MVYAAWLLLPRKLMLPEILFSHTDCRAPLYAAHLQPAGSGVLADLCKSDLNRRLTPEEFHIDRGGLLAVIHFLNDSDGVFPDTCNDGYTVSDFEIDRNVFAPDAKRLHAAIQEAARQISEVPEEQVSDEPLSQDFFNHWRREAEMIDDEALRQWWARLLVEETKTPKSISPRTLDVVKNLSQEEADIFRTMIRGSIAGVIPVDESGHPQFVNYKKRLLMHEAGLLIPDQSTRTYNQRQTDDGEMLVVVEFAKSDYLICTTGEKLELRCCVLTMVGRQIARVISNGQTVDEVIGIAKFLGERFKGRRFSVHKINHSRKDGLYWQIEPEWASDFMKIQPK